MAAQNAAVSNRQDSEASVEKPPSTSDSAGPNGIETHLVIEHEQSNSAKVLGARRTSDENPNSPPPQKKRHAVHPIGENDEVNKRLRHSCVSSAEPGVVVHVSDVSCDEESVESGDCQGDDEMSLSAPIPSHVTADTVSKLEAPCRVPSLQTNALKSSGIFFDDTELPIACGNHPLMSPASSVLSSDVLLNARVKFRSTAFIPLLPCPRLPTRTLQSSSDQSGSWAVPTTHNMLNGSSCVPSPEASRILQEEKMDRLRSYLLRRDASRRRKRKAEAQQAQKRQALFALTLPAVKTVLPSPAPSSSTNVDKFNSCSPDVLDAAMALTMCLSKAPTLPKEGPIKNDTPVGPPKTPVLAQSS